MRYTLWLLLASSALMVGCGDLLSLHALYTRQDQVFDPAIEGKWENADNALSVKRVEDRYELLLEGRPKRREATKFEVHLVDVAGVRFADMLASDQIGHMIVRVRHTAGKLQVAFLDSPWLREHVPHDDADIELWRKQAIFTDPTAQLKTVVAKYATEEKAYDKELVFSRAK